MEKKRTCINYLSKKNAGTGVYTSIKFEVSSKNAVLFFAKKYHKIMSNIAWVEQIIIVLSAKCR